MKSDKHKFIIMVEERECTCENGPQKPQVNNGLGWKKSN